MTEVFDLGSFQWCEERIVSEDFEDPCRVAGQRPELAFLAVVVAHEAEIGDLQIGAGAASSQNACDSRAFHIAQQSDHIQSVQSRMNDHQKFTPF